MVKKYVRLLSYPNAVKFIDFVNQELEQSEKESDEKQCDIACVTPGGVSMYINENNLPKYEKFLKGMGVRYEIGDVRPDIVNKEIINSFKS